MKCLNSLFLTFLEGQLISWHLRALVLVPKVRIEGHCEYQIYAYLIKSMLQRPQPLSQVPREPEHQVP